MKVSHFTIIAVMFVCCVANAQQNRLKGYCNVNAGLFMPELEDDDGVILDGDGGLVEFGIGFEPARGIYLGCSIFHGSSVVDTTTNMGMVGATDIESDIYSAALFFDFKYDFLSPIPNNRVSLIAGISVGFVENMLGETELDIASPAWQDMTYDEGDNTSIAARFNLMFRINFSRRFNAYIVYQYVDLGMAETGSKVTYQDGSTATIDPVELDTTADVLAIGVMLRF